MPKSVIQKLSKFRQVFCREFIFEKNFQQFFEKARDFVLFSSGFGGLFSREFEKELVLERPFGLQLSRRQFEGKENAR